MQYSFDEIHTLNLLSDDESYSKHFNVPPDLKIMTGLILIALFTAVGCAIYFQVDKIVPAQGVLETKDKLFVVRNTESGFIDQILVEQGQSVQTGDLLVQLDSQLVELEIDQLQHEMKKLARSLWTDYYQIERLLEPDTKQQLEQALLDIPNGIAQLGYQSHLARPLDDSMTLLQQRLVENQRHTASAKSQLTRLNKAVELAKRKRDKESALHKKGYQSERELDFSQQALLDLQVRQSAQQGNIKVLDAERGRLKAEIAKLQSEYVLERLLRLHDQLDAYQQNQLQLVRQQRLRDDLSIRAPFAGTVDGLSIKGQRELVPSSTSLMSLRPAYEQEDLEVSIHIPASHAIWVEPGMTFRAIAKGNSPDDHGHLMGEIAFMAKSTEATNGQRIYRMIGKIHEFNTIAGDSLLRPGMELSVEIKAGQRRLINYFFDPFTKHFRTALSEPS